MAMPMQGASAAVAAPQNQIALSPLWEGENIEIIGLTGEFNSGKTLFGLTICPGAGTIVTDDEGSTATYQSLGFTRVDMAKELRKAFPGGYTPMQRFVWWKEWVSRELIPGKYRVYMIDPINDIEDGCAQYVRANADKFGYTRSQFDKSSGLFWGAMKAAYKPILDDIRSRVETFVFVTHMRDAWAGGVPTGKREPKGKETLFQLASLYLEMDRKANAKGEQPEVPAATVLKSRLAKIGFVEGKVQTVAILPPRLPKATPDAIREYIRKPANFEKLKAGERLAAEEFTEEQKLRMQANVYQKQTEAVQAQTTLEEVRMKAAAEQAAAMQRMATIQPQAGIAADASGQRAVAVEQRAAANGTNAAAAQFAAQTWAQEARGENDPCYEHDRTELLRLMFETLSMPQDHAQALIDQKTGRPNTRSAELTVRQCRELIAELQGDDCPFGPAAAAPTQ